MNKIVQQPQDIRPYAQEALGGALGLTNHDMAKALGVEVRNVTEKMARPAFAEMCKALESGFAVSTVKSGGRPGRLFVIDVNAAKAFVAKWDNERGWGYLRFLLGCERVVEQAVPKLQAELAAAHCTIAKLTEPQQRRIPGKGIVSVIVRTLRVVDLFGEISEEIHREKKLYSELSEPEKRRYKLSQRAAVMRGIAALQDDDLNPKGALN